LPSTEGYNRGRRFEYYKTLESLKEYVLVASDHADLFTGRTAAGFSL
jgi:hypothetical protein